MFKRAVLRALCAGLTCMAAALVAAGCGDESTSTDSSEQEPSRAGELEGASGAAAVESDTPPDDAPQEDTEGKEFTATTTSGQPEGGPAIWRAAKGDTVRITVTSDVADELHLHGYDVSKDVAAGGTATLELVADTSGSFELELEDAGSLIGNLEVR